MNRMEQLLAFCDWERKHNPHPEGKPHVAEWAAAEIERLNMQRRELQAEREMLLERCARSGMEARKAERERLASKFMAQAKEAHDAGSYSKRDELSAAAGWVLKA